MGCSEGPFWAEKGAGVWPLQDTVALAWGLKRMRMRSSKGQAEARSLSHMAKLAVSLRSVIWVRVFQIFQHFKFCSEKMSKTEL